MNLKYVNYNDGEEKRYAGDSDTLWLRSGFGTQEFFKKKTDEKYEGNFDRDTYNNYGMYKCYGISEMSWTYEGKFLSNRREGFGCLSYGDGSTFYGLYKGDIQFGPGVYTNVDHTEDVGLWIGSRIARLSVKVSHMEKLGAALWDKMRLATYKKLVSITDEPPDVATSIMSQMTEDEELIKDSYKLYSSYCKNPYSLLFDHKYFRKNSLEDLKTIEEKLIEESLKSSEAFGAKFLSNESVEIKKRSDELFQPGLAHLLAWNNSSRIIELMKHSFRYRNDEENATDFIRDILCKRKLKYNLAGSKEAASVDALIACEKNNDLELIKLIRDHNIDINVMDNNGNSLLITAAAHNSHKVMKLLKKLRVRMSCVNDEGFSALTYCLTKYVACLREIVDWPAAFLAPMDPNLSDVNVKDLWMKCSEENIFPTSFLTKPVTMPHQEYLFDLHLEGPKDQTKLEKLPTKDKKFKSQVSMRGTKMSVFSHKFSLNNLEEGRKKKLKNIEKSICFLLDNKINIKISSVPQDSMVLALFTGNPTIVEKLLQRGINPNNILMNGNLTAVHILPLIQPLSTHVKVMEVLVNYDADINMKTSPEFVDEIRPPFCGFYPSKEFPITGLTSLQLLCIRLGAATLDGRKYLEDLCCFLLTLPKEEVLFCGHNPLGLAIASSNCNFIKCLIESGGYDINASTNRYWGNPLTEFFLLRGMCSSPADDETFLELTERGANPFAKVFISMMSKEGNVFNFFEFYVESLMMNLSRIGSNIRKNEGDKKAFEKKLGETDKIKWNTAFQRMKQLTDLGRNILNQNVKGLVTRKLVETCSYFIEENYSAIEKAVEISQNWLDNGDFADILKKQAEAQIIEIKNPNIISHLLDLLPRKKITLKERDKSKSKITLMGSKEKKKANLKNHLSSADIMPNLIGVLKEHMKVKKRIDKGEISREDIINKFNLLKNPELDLDRDTYYVCFNCLKRNTNLQKCPKCNLVYFCSKKCNSEDVNNSKSKHKCKLLFYGISIVQGSFLEKPKTSIKKSPSQVKMGKNVELLKGILSSSYYDETEDVEKKSKSEKVVDVDKKKGSKVGRISKPSTPKLAVGIESIEDVDTSKESLSSQENLKGKKKKSVKTLEEKQSQMKTIQKGIKSKKGAKKTQKQKKLTKKIKKRALKKGRKVGKDTQSRIKKRKEKWKKLMGKGEGPGGPVKKRKPVKILKVNLKKEYEERIKLREAVLGIDDLYQLLGLRREEVAYWDKEMEKCEGDVKSRFSVILQRLLKIFGSSFNLDQFYPYVIFKDGCLYYKCFEPGPNFKENYSLN